MQRGYVVVFGLVIGWSLSACGPGNREDCDPATVMTDHDNCGVCGNVCADTESCVGGICTEAACTPGTVEECFTGPETALGVGVCVGGHRTCNSAGTWSECVGEVVPSMEVCGNGLDENCNGESDENVDLDADGYTTCDGDCADNNNLVNPGAFESVGNNIDDDCDGVPDNVLAACDVGLLSNSGDGLDFARAMDLCQTTTLASKRWGVIDAALSLANGAGTPVALGRAIRQGFGTAMPTQHGEAFAVISSGVAADASDTNPNFVAGGDVYHTQGLVDQTSGFPADWLAANGGTLPNAPGCPGPSGAVANDPVMLTMHIRVPSNAKSFSMKLNFISHEFPEYVCTQYNDMFVILLDSTWAGDPANPADKNLAFYTNPSTMERTPVGVNLAHDNTGLYTMCVNGTGGCSGSPAGTFPITTCIDSSMLAGTGFDEPADFACSTGQLDGGGTGWLTTSGNVVGGEIITLRIAIWDTSDHVYDSTAIIDDFQWSVDVADPGTVIE